MYEVLWILFVFVLFKERTAYVVYTQGKPLKDSLALFLNIIKFSLSFSLPEV